MKITVHWLTADIENEGTSTEVFATRADLLQSALAEYVESLLDEIENRSADFTIEAKKLALRCRELIDAGDLEGAWSLYLDDDGDESLKRPDDLFWTGTDEIEVPDPTSDNARLREACAAAEYWLTEEVANPGETTPKDILIHLREALASSPESQRNAVLADSAPDLLYALNALAKEIKLSKLNIRKDFSLINAHACALKVIDKASNSQNSVNSVQVPPA